MIPKQQVIAILDKHIKRLNGSSTLEIIKEEIETITPTSDN